MPTEHELVSYVLAWPCEEQVSPRAFLARSVGTGEPGSGKFASRPLALGTITSGSDLSLALVEGDWGDARVAEVFTTAHDQLAERWRAGDTTGWLVPLSALGKLGQPVPLSNAHVTRGMASCFNQSSGFDIQHADVDGRPPEEVIVARHDVSERPRPSPDYECDTVEETSYLVYRFVSTARNATLVRMATPKGIEEKLAAAQGAP
jgi:hypothetical protein